MDLEDMQKYQPWTQPYSDPFRAMASGLEPHREMMHCVMHINKAVGVLSSICEWNDHGTVRTDKVSQEDLENRTADLVMCALRIASLPPRPYSKFDLELAVHKRTEAVNGQSFVDNAPKTAEAPSSDEVWKLFCRRIIDQLVKPMGDVREALNVLLMAQQSVLRGPMVLDDPDTVNEPPKVVQPPTLMEVMMLIEKVAGKMNALSNAISNLQSQPC